MSEAIPAAERAPLPGDDGRRQLSPRAVPYWRLRLGLVLVPAGLLASVVLVLALGALPVAVPVLVLAWAVLGAVILQVPRIRHGIWWYAIGEEEVDLHEGFVVVTRTVVPMVRVQHVDLHRGPLSTRLGLAEIELHTAAGSVTIPALDAPEAERIRAQVAVLARVPDDV
jgi:membrane protein YdbS with pleckstrin-like domain